MPACSYSPAWLPTPTPENEPTLGEDLQGGGLLGNRRGLAEGELEHAGAEGYPPGRCGGDGQHRQRLQTRSVPKQVVADPQPVGTHLLGLVAELGHPFDRIGRAAASRRSVSARRVRCPGGSRVLHEGGKDESNRPPVSHRSVHGHSAS